ncbi:hypothetical protein BS78_04G014600 [Paspalum vaginatum]|nr:hypothetical protein BS78_04G014600 [Paspalum vaginatum]
MRHTGTLLPPWPSMAARRRAALHRVFLVAVAAGGAAAGGAAKVPAMFVFGDSTADVGINGYLAADFPHNGVDFPGGGRPTASHRYGGSAALQPTTLPLSMATAAASSNITEGMRNRTNAAAAAYMTGANFASGGSGLPDSTGSTISMTQQIEYFSDLKDQMLTRLSTDRVVALLSKSIFLISAGPMMHLISSRGKDHQTPLQFSEAMISTYDSHIKTLYHLGARKFNVINVPLIGCYPYLRSQNPTGECVEPLNQLAKSLNDGIRDLFSSETQGMKYSIASAYQLVSILIQNPHAAGLEEVKSACAAVAGSMLRAGAPPAPATAMTAASTYSEISCTLPKLLPSLRALHSMTDQHSLSVPSASSS